ncbi:tRNA (guanosine(18)-2'-O)-methyltransferase TrmH [Saccharobesus litoralis]|uniref:tRNA (guanosine(18)-2'-O)-methyltransferase n=1 Tax=Saccharobesus litoralis TaxID=2172099 RepID=A0A2S0VRI3_9ALTE|nr:tRNA (guanosine(18)-2'-O)-methyltransferase TrmH [Saccharobesus litoralis]AWB66809.1 tRNA (guanosine(18)-2'-O)-methyltransferase TrmH [Saccharobesus litoralis]
MISNRIARINQLLDKRQPDLTVCMENVHKPHNLSAVVRTADAVGVHRVHAIWSRNNAHLGNSTASGSQKWVDVANHYSLDDALQTLKSENMQILATHLSDESVDYREIDYTKPTAIMLGTEKFGISEQAIAAADHCIVIPMVGMVQSLNVSVANALVLYEAQRQRQAAGMYDTPRLAKAERDRVLFEGGHPIFAQACIRKGLPYPAIDENGEIIASDEWWQKMQMDQSAWQHIDDE